MLTTEVALTKPLTAQVRHALRRNSARICFERARQRSIERATRGVFVAAAAEPRGDRGHIHLAFAAQAQADAPLGQFAQKDRGLHARRADGDIHNALAILLGGAGADHVLVRHPKPGQAAFAFEPAERRAQQQQL